MADKHILRIHDTEANLLANLKDKQISWATDIKQIIWRDGNNFYYIDPDKFWDGTQFVDINAEGIYNIFTWDDYVTALSDVRNTKFLYMRDNIVAPSTAIQNLDVYGICEVVVYSGSQIFANDPNGGVRQLRYRGASGSPVFTALNFLGNEITYVGFDNIFIQDVSVKMEKVFSSIPVDVQLSNGGEAGQTKFQYEYQDGNFTCSVGASDFVRQTWTVPILDIQTDAVSGESGIKPKSTDFFNNGSNVLSGFVDPDKLNGYATAEINVNNFLGIITTPTALSGSLRKTFSGGSVGLNVTDGDILEPFNGSGNDLLFIGRGQNFSDGTSTNGADEVSLAIICQGSNPTLKIGDVSTGSNIYVEVLHIYQDITFDPASTCKIYYEKLVTDGSPTITDTAGVLEQKIWRNTLNIPNSDLNGAIVLKNIDGTYSVCDDTSAPPFYWDSANATFRLSGVFLTLANQSGLKILDNSDVLSGFIYGQSGILKIDGDIDTTGGTLTANDPTLAQQVATKSYVDSQAGGSQDLASVLGVGETTGNNKITFEAHTNASVTSGDLWFTNNAFRYTEDTKTFKLFGVDQGVFGSDLNTFIISGSFLTSDSALTNIPSGWSASTRKIVNVYSNSGRIIQTIFEPDSADSKMAFRTTDDSGTNWSSWTPLTQDLQSVTDVGFLSDNPIYLQNTTSSVLSGFVSFWGSGVGTSGKRYATLKQQNGYAEIFAGSNSLAASNELRINCADSAGDEKHIATFKSGAFQLQISTNASPTNGDIWFDGTNLKGREGGATFNLNGGGVTPGSWTTATLQTNWEARSGYRAVRYRDNGIDGTEIEGVAKLKTAQSLLGGGSVVLFTLPVALRPTAKLTGLVSCTYEGSWQSVTGVWYEVDTNGDVTITNSNSTLITELYNIGINIKFAQS